MEYRVHLSQFSGPLDLLLHLVEKAEVDIKDIFVSEITSEFLEYLKEIDELDMEQASSFLTVAATLVYMKSRSLFPPAPKEEEEEEDPGELLISSCVSTRLLRKHRRPCASWRMRRRECIQSFRRSFPCRLRK